MKNNVGRCIGHSGDMYYIVNPDDKQSRSSPIQLIECMSQSDVRDLAQSGKSFSNMNVTSDGSITFKGNGLNWDVHSAYTMFESICEFLSRSLKLGKFQPSRMYTSSRMEYTYLNYKSPVGIKYMGENRGFHVYFRVKGDTQEFPLYTLLELYMYDPFHPSQKQYFMRCFSVTDIEAVCKRFLREVIEAKRALARNEIDSFLDNCIAYAYGTPDGIYFLMDTIQEKAPRFGYTPSQVVHRLNRRAQASMKIFHAAYESMASKISEEYNMGTEDFMREPINYALVSVLTKGFIHADYDSKVAVCKPELLCYLSKNFAEKP